MITPRRTRSNARSWAWSALLPNDAGKYDCIGSQVTKLIARLENTSDVHELATLAGDTSR
jgi:hypothetical protein